MNMSGYEDLEKPFFIDIKAGRYEISNPIHCAGGVCGSQQYPGHTFSVLGPWVLITTPTGNQKRGRADKAFKEVQRLNDAGDMVPSVRVMVLPPTKSQSLKAARERAKARRLAGDKFMGSQYNGRRTGKFRKKTAFSKLARLRREELKKMQREAVIR